MSVIGTNSYNFQETVRRLLHWNYSGTIQYLVYSEISYCQYSHVTET